MELIGNDRLVILCWVIKGYLSLHNLGHLVLAPSVPVTQVVQAPTSDVRMPNFSKEHLCGVNKLNNNIHFFWFKNRVN